MVESNVQDKVMLMTCKLNYFRIRMRYISRDCLVYSQCKYKIAKNKSLNIETYNWKQIHESRTLTLAVLHVQDTPLSRTMFSWKVRENPAKLTLVTQLIKKIKLSCLSAYFDEISTSKFKFLDTASLRRPYQRVKFRSLCYFKTTNSNYK